LIEWETLPTRVFGLFAGSKVPPTPVYALPIGLALVPTASDNAAVGLVLVPTTVAARSGAPAILPTKIVRRAAAGDMAMQRAGSFPEAWNWEPKRAFTAIELTKADPI